jgi:DNA-binding SARP family transcriptional activator/tRNA A-37 threonylcarbamoyl transferase component Bud32
MTLSPERLRVYLSGGVRVERGGLLIRQRSFSFPYAALAFAYFVCERDRPISGRDLAGIFWADAPPADGEALIRATTQKLRRALTRQALGLNLRVSGRELYDLDAPNDTWVDIEAAAEAIHDAEGELRAGRPATAFGPSAVAHHIARRPFLVGESGPWVEAQRERLRGMLVRALECRGEVFLWNGETLLAIEAAKEAVALEPFRETAHQLLIRAHAALGNAADANRAYNHCREILATQLGIEPSSQTERVYQSALGSGPSGTTTVDSPATVAQHSPVPRGDLRAQIQRLLCDVYRIDEELGGGAMSRVFRAEERAFGRQVVIKVLPPDSGETFSADRFAREVRLAANLQQANIVPVLSAAVVGGIPYYTMPFVSGRSLREALLQGTPLTIPSVISILRDVGRALAFAHLHNIVHRDIKPENILLSGATAVVTDFGVAKAVEAAGGEAETSTRLTGFGTRVGTPHYMAPEQIMGAPPIDGRTDIYSYGIVGYELLAGRSPFAERNAQAALAAHLAEQPGDVRELRLDTPPALADLVMRCVKKDCHLRPQSMAEVLSALEVAAVP